MKLLPVLAVLLVTFEFAPSAVAAPVSDLEEEEARAMLQVFKSIIASVEDNAQENQALIAATSAANSTTESPTTPASTAASSTPDLSTLTSCFFFPHFKRCYYCANPGGQRIVMCFVKP